MVESLSFFLGQDFQAGRPPAGLNRFNEFVRQAFHLHFTTEPVVIINDWMEVMLNAVSRDVQSGKPNIGCIIILRPSKDTNINKLPKASVGMPFDASMGTCNTIHFPLMEEYI